MATVWDDFPDADEWADFPDAEPARKRKRKKRSRPEVEGRPVDSAVDGDTFRVEGQPNVRLLGVDAPELKQVGWDQSGAPVPVGQDSLGYASQLLSGGAGTVGKPDHFSFGRPVAPINIQDADAGRQLIRNGQAFAAPQYLEGDPERRLAYNEAQRLADINGLGLHDYKMQTPADFRDEPVDDPQFLSDRETTAVWWDTPTPNTGMPAEIEQQYLQLLQTGTADEINAFLKANGFETSRYDDLAAWVRRRDEKGDVDYSVSYEEAPPLMIDSGDGAGGAFARKFGAGFLAGGLDEAGAVVDTLGGTPGRESLWNSDRRLADIWSNNQKQNAGILSYDQTNHPVASTFGEVGGAITSGFAIPYGAGARTVPQLAKVGGVWGGAEGFLGTDGGIPQRLTGAAIGAPLGAAVNAVGGKALEYGAPLVAKGVRRALGRDGETAARAAGETAQGYGEEQVLDEALDATVRAPDEWADFPDAPAEAMPAAMPMADEPLPSFSMSAPPGALGAARRLLDPTSKAELMASASRIQPSDVLPFPGNRVDGVDEAAGIEAGRYAEALPYDERKALSRGTVRNWRGEDVPKVGPLDLVGYIRTLGGVRDDGGDLAHMGITGNAARRGMDFVGQETRFGPLVDPEGMSLDDAALSAWEAGYFPQTDRPDINTFLEALGETYNDGAGRRFRPDDLAELEAYDNLRAERIDLEAQRSDGGSIVNDMSRPADDAPFPPVQAYEEWPSDAIARVGNIDVTKLDSPQDIARALKATDNALGGFDAAKRGRITQAETERLASELNMTPEQLLSRRKGQAFNAEEALAARQILAKSGNELVNAAKALRRLGEDPGSEALAEFRKKWMRHAAIQEQVAGMTSEAGRALQQFRQAANARAIRGDVLSALVRAGGGKDSLQDAANALLDAVEMGPGKFNALAAKAAKPKWQNKFSELYINMLLSNPPTHIVNMVSNTLTSMLQIPEYATGAAVGAARRALAGPKAAPRILASEVGARAFGLLQGTKEGASLFAKALRTGEADDFVSKVEGDEYKAISGLKGEVIRLPTRFLTAEDQLFKGVARRMALNGLAARKAAREGLEGEALSARIAELVSDPTDEMFEEAMDYGRYLTFQQKLGPAGQSVSTFTSNFLPGKIIVPFVRTPINLLKFATERSPAAPLLKEFRDDFRAGGERRDIAIARMMLGSGLAATMYQAAQDGKITGAVPPDPAKARLMYADGWQPYSVKVGDQWVSYSRLDPLSTTIGVAADMATLPDGLSDRQADDKFTMLTASIMGNLASKTWLSGATSFVEGLSDPGRYAGNWVERTAGAFTVPAGVAGVARAIDPVMRKRDSIGEAIQARVPGMTDELLPARDVFGEVIELSSWGPDFLSPFWSSQSKDDPVIGEMLRIGKSVSAPGKQYTEDGERIDFAPEEYDRYHEIAGRLTYNRLFGLIGSEDYRGMSDDARRKAAKKAIRDARKTARGLINDPDYPLPAKGAQEAFSAFPAAQSSADPFADFPDAGEGGSDAFADFPDAPQRDVVGNLQRAIPGVGITSGFRTREYQADMRRRGYKPAENSAHLDGSALDLVPPPGKSMGWLMDRVEGAEPGAYMLPEGDHLHVIFPDWQGAPVLGNARSAGLSNPAGAR